MSEGTRFGLARHAKFRDELSQTGTIDRLDPPNSSWPDLTPPEQNISYPPSKLDYVDTFQRAAAMDTYLFQG